MATNIRVHELAKELGMTNAEAVDLCQVLGVPVKSHSSSLNEAYSDMVRRRAVRDGLTRAEQPPEPQPEAKLKKAPAKATAKQADPAADTKAETTTDSTADITVDMVVAETPVVEVAPTSIDGNGAPAVETVAPEQTPEPPAVTLVA